MFLIAFVILIVMSGCRVGSDGGWQLNPFAADTIESVADSTAGVFSLLFLFIPGVAGATGIAAGAAAAFKKMKPGLVKYRHTTQHMVLCVEKIKKTQPELWAKIKSEFKEGTNADIEAVIDQIVALEKKA